MNGCFVWFPLVAPSSEFKGEVLWGGGLSAFIGATIFELGSVMMILEAVNENRTECFGWALEHMIEDDAVRLVHAKGGYCNHHHAHSRSLLRSRSMPAVPSDGDLRDVDGRRGSPKSQAQCERLWSWCPTWHELRTHYFREIGFLASFSQLLGATIFWIAGIAGFPPAYERLHGKSLNGLYWSPQVRPFLPITVRAGQPVGLKYFKGRGWLRVHNL